jgi:hypothetical protein
MGKPAPLIYEACLRQLGVPADQVGQAKQLAECRVLQRAIASSVKRMRKPLPVCALLVNRGREALYIVKCNYVPRLLRCLLSSCHAQSSMLQSTTFMALTDTSDAQVLPAPHVVYVVRDAGTHSMCGSCCLTAQMTWCNAL